ncbi:MAG: hypothetical protein ACYCOS_05350 [Sulfobacillus sp.]
MADASSAVYHTAARILTGVKEFRRLRQEHPDQDPSPFLLLTLVSAAELVLFIEPDPNPATFHGGSSEMSGEESRPLSFRHRERPAWDFGPWFAEKSWHLYAAARDLASLWMASREAPDPHSRERMDLLVAQVETYGRAIFDQLTDGDLIVETVPAPEF